MIKYLVGIIVIALVAVGAFLFIGRDDNKSDAGTNQQTQTTTPPTSTTPSNNQTQTTANQVGISNFAFSPTDITIKKGTTVTWTNNDSVAHTVKFESSDIPESENLGNGQSFSFTFNNQGTFNYICGLHPSMHGTVTVTE